mmetsp:Transcript_17420/g.31406  ORF Transcript_17420/g.31406 Transcript_17420/m.31406 type:complete len:745 (-) Transcript_17420:183-2417(-)
MREHVPPLPCHAPSDDFRMSRHPSGPNALRFDGGMEDWVHVPSPDDTTLVNRPKRRVLWLLLAIASVGMSIIAALLEAIARGLTHLSQAPAHWSELAGVSFHTACCMVMVISCYLLGIVITRGSEHQVRQYIGGSGIPELKCELTGVHLVGLFSWRVLLSKFVGLALCLGSNLPAGAEGTFVHVATGIGHMMMLRIKFFRGILQLRALRHMVMTAMVAVGVGCTFGAPIGGVLYAVEMIDAFGSVAYLHSFFGATVAGVVLICMRSFIAHHVPLVAVIPLFQTDVKSNQADLPTVVGMIFFYMLLGLLCGILGAAFIRCHSVLVRFVRWSCSLPAGVVRAPAMARLASLERARDGPPSIDASWMPRTPVAGGNDGSMHGDEPVVMQTFSMNVEEVAEQAASSTRVMRVVLLLAVVALTNSLLLWVQPLLRDESPALLLSRLVSTNEGVEETALEAVELAIAFVTKFSTAAVVLALPLPVGAIVPTFVIGALFGRWFARLTQPLCDAQFCDEPLEFEARAAMVGASAFCAGSMRSFAQVIVVFELTGLADILIPLCASSLIAVFVANSLGLGFVDSVIMAKRLPHLPSLAQGREALSVADIMRPATDIPMLPPHVRALELQTVLEMHKDWQYEVPIVLRPSALRPQASPTATMVGTPSAMMRQCDRGNILLSAVRDLPPLLSIGSTGINLMESALVPLQVPAHTTLKALLPLFSLLEKSVAFVTRNGSLAGAVTLTDLYERACKR